MRPGQYIPYSKREWPTLSPNLRELMRREGPLTKQEAGGLLEDVLDTLVEVGNGVSNEDVHVACDLLFKFRDDWFKNQGE